MHGG